MHPTPSNNGNHDQGNNRHHNDFDGQLLPIERANDTPLEHWITRFVDHLKDQSQVSATTIEHYTHDLWLLMRYVITFKPEALCPKAIDPPLIRDFQKHMSDVRSNLPSSVRRRLAAINRFFMFLVDQGVVTENPMDEIPTVKARTRPPVVLTKRECHRILEAAKTTSHPLRDYAIFKLFLSSGCTLSELLGLEVDDFDRQEGTISFVGRDNYKRTVTLTVDCFEALVRYLDIRPKAPADQGLFLNRNGYRITKGAVYHAFRLILVRAGIDRKDVTVHTLRHTSLTLMWQDGVGVFQLQQIAGHASLATTRRYTRTLRRHVMPGGKQKFRIVSRRQS